MGKSVYIAIARLKKERKLVSIHNIDRSYIETDEETLKMMLRGCCRITTWKGIRLTRKS